MISTAQFLELTPDAQREIILDGITHIKAKAFELSTSLAKFNGWMATLDATLIDPQYSERFNRLGNQLQENIDVLTEQILIEAQKRRHISEYMAKQKS